MKIWVAKEICEKKKMRRDHKRIEFQFKRKKHFRGIMAGMCAQRDTLVYIYPIIVDVFFQPWASLWSFMIVLQPCDSVFAYLWFDFVYKTTLSTSLSKEILLPNIISC